MSASFTLSLPIESRRRSHDFYRAAFDLNCVGEPDADGMPEPLQFALGEDARLMLIPKGGFEWVVGKERMAPRGTSECLLSFTEPNPDAVRDRAQKCVAAGGSILSEPSQKDWGFQAIIADPDGHLWMILAQ